MGYWILFFSCDTTDVFSVEYLDIILWLILITEYLRHF